MVTSRTITSVRPVFPYGGRAYKILYFGTSRRGPFSIKELKSCLSGAFPHQRGNEDFWISAKKLEKAGCIDRVDKDLWQVTETGVMAMVTAAAYHREFRIRTLGHTYINDAHARIAKINSSRMSIMEMLDAEDTILEEIEQKMARRRTKGKKRKKT